MCKMNLIMKMKHIIPLILMLLFFGSCSWEQTLADKGVELRTRGVMEVEIAENGAGVEDKIETIRFIVFTNMASMPKVEINEFYDEDDFMLEDPSGEKAAAKVRIVLEVGRKTNGGNNKLVVAIVNEPAGMKRDLDAVMSPAQLAALPLDMSHFLNNDHLSLKDGVPMPMSGAVWTDKVYATEDEARADMVKLTVQRAVAKVEVFLKGGPDVDAGLKIASGSTVTLDNTCAKGNLVRHEDSDGHVLGSIPTVASANLIERSWTSTSELAMSATESVCVFYTPERNCVTDKLKLTVTAKTSEGAERSGSFVLSTARNEERGEETVNVVRRNNIYRVTATVTANAITAEVQNWEDENISTEF